jgi:peptide/nickel transport system permease protein
MATATATAKGLATAAAARPGRSIWRTMRRNRSVQIGVTLVGVLLFASVFAPVLATYPPNEINFAEILTPPSRVHYFGTDDLGRDIYSRVLYAGRISISIGFLVMFCTTITGGLIGTLSGYYQRVDSVAMRSMDIVMSFPDILLALGIMAVLGPSFFNIIIALVIGFTPGTARMIRGQILSLRNREFTEAARAIGMGDARIIMRHLVPNAMAPMFVQQTAVIAGAVLAESGLNFLGVGLPPDIPTLGGMLASSRSFLREAYWMALFPGLMIGIFVLGVNLLGDGLRDVFDPHLNH